ncbi:sensor domain-containing diguanylate cyclase [Sinorhizobium americanum]|uniref:diguanylate cyclase n=1 Tax=Sinorhizobium americanum TaxID=194963 RepID=A0A1L3LX84_9HYPH|nr:sensor domain-containing diguanylate cyclase [Sinorhizobium americanum]APG94719.1 response regulator PleD [Sinorhizobium americanum]OAP48752.1 diguanylate cyclase [Sinorhizobium americanum]
MAKDTRRLFELFETSPVLVAAYDGFDRLHYANAAFRSAYFITPDEMPLWPDLMRRNFHAQRGTVIRAGDFEEWLRSTQSRRGKVGFRSFETDLFDGRWLWMTETVEKDGWMLCVATDVTGLKAKTRTVRQDRDLAIKASYTDELTGVANRRFVTARIEDMLQRNEQSSPGCLCVLDIDRFKSINDQFGHQTGDAILRDFAMRIHRLVRRTDCFGRVGGEEFVLTLPATPVEQARLILERMLASVRRSRPLQERPDFGYTFSAGIAGAHPGDTAISLYARADRALYMAKLAGRDRIHLDEPDPDRSAVAG